GAGKFVICAGSIETTRILLELKETFSNRFVRSTSKVGEFLGDHLSITIADVDSNSLKLTAQMFAPRFKAGYMRGFRFVQKDLKPNQPRAFAHIIFNNESLGFELAKNLMSSLQQRQLPKLRPADMVGGFSDLMLLAYKRLVQSKLHIPTGT